MIIGMLSSPLPQSEFQTGWMRGQSNLKPLHSKRKVTLGQVVVTLARACLHFLNCKLVNTSTCWHRCSCNSTWWCHETNKNTDKCKNKRKNKQIGKFKVSYGEMCSSLQKRRLLASVMWHVWRLCCVSQWLASRTERKNMVVVLRAR